MNIIELVGFIPAIIFPTATLIQLWHLLKSKSAAGVSALAWAAFALGNISMYVYTEKYTQLQTIVGLLFTAILQMAIIFLVLKYNRQNQSSR